jgi:hypothetical protein
MTTIRIDDSMVGMTVAQNGVMTNLTFVTSSRQIFANLTLVDDSAPHDVVPWQLFNSDLLCSPTNANGALQVPAGVMLDGSVNFGNLTVAACPAGAVFSITCTGALAQPIPAATAIDRLIASTVHAEAFRAALKRGAEEQIIAAERARTWSPPPPPQGVEQPPPPPPDPAVADANARARAQIEAAALARVKAVGPTVFGPSQDAIRDEWLIWTHSQRALAVAGAAANAVTEARVASMKAARAAEQARATELLKQQGHLGG